MPYPANLFQVQWIWEGASQLAEDAYVNTFHFKNEAAVIGDYENIVDMLKDFYLVTPPGTTVSIVEWMTNESISGNWTVKIYDLADPKPRYPVFTDTGITGMSGASALPSEVASVMSFQGVRIAGEVQARRRNRIYLGPFGIAANTNGMCAPGLVETILFAGKEFLAASKASNSWTWSIYSPTDNDIVEIDNGWCDNGWDTQRRRGVRSTGRGTFGDGFPT